MTNTGSTDTGSTDTGSTNTEKPAEAKLSSLQKNKNPLIGFVVFLTASGALILSSFIALALISLVIGSLF